LVCNGVVVDAKASVNVGVEDLIGIDVLVGSSIAAGCTWEHDVMSKEAKMTSEITGTFFIFVLSRELRGIAFAFFSSPTIWLSHRNS